MGYDIEMDLQDVMIPAGKVGAALKALKELMDEADHLGSGGSGSPGGKSTRNFSWVDTEVVLKAIENRDLKAALDEWRYEAQDGEKLAPIEQLASGEEFCDVVVAYFSSSKWGDDEHLWATLAPFVEKGATIEFRGEDDHRWRYLFLGDALKEQTGETVWSDSYR